MIHLCQHANGKYEVVTFENGNVIVHSNPQQYETKAGCYTNMKAQMKNFHGAFCLTFQDNTLDVPMQFCLYETGKPIQLDDKVKTKYILNKGLVKLVNRPEKKISRRTFSSRRAAKKK